MSDDYWETNYPTHIEVPESYWPITTMIVKDYDPNKYWHKAEDD